MSFKGNPVRKDPAAQYLSRSLTIAPRSMQAVVVKTNTRGRCLLSERPNAVAEKGLRVPCGLLTANANRDFRLYLTNVTARAVNLPKCFAIGYAFPHDGPADEVPLDNFSASREGAVREFVLGQETYNHVRAAKTSSPGSGAAALKEALEPRDAVPTNDNEGDNPI